MCVVSHAFAAQRAHARVADGVRRQTGHVAAVQPELREAGGDIGLSPAEGRRQQGRLKEPFEPRRD
jgi:hypothetical protein